MSTTRVATVGFNPFCIWLILSEVDLAVLIDHNLARVWSLSREQLQELGRVSLDPEQGHGGADLMECGLREGVPGNTRLDPPHLAPIRMHFGPWFDVEVALNSAQVHCAVRFGRANDVVADLHLVDEAGQDAGPHRNGPRFSRRVRRGEAQLQRFAVGGDGAEIAELLPADADETPVHQVQRGLVVVDTPDGRHEVTVVGGPAG